MTDDTKPNALAVLHDSRTLLGRLAQAVADAPIDQTPHIKLAMSKLEDVLEEITRINRNKIDMFMSVPGNATQVTDKGTLESYIDGHRIRYIPTSSLPKAEEVIKALARRGHVKPDSYSKYFKEEVKYKTTDLTLSLLVADGLLTQSDVKALTEHKDYRLEVKPPVEQATEE